MPESRILISPEGSDLSAALVAHGGVRARDCIRFDAPNNKYLLFTEAGLNKDDLLRDYTETRPHYDLTNATFYYFEYNDPTLLANLRALAASHPDIVIDAGPDIIEPVQILEPLLAWLDARAKARPDER